MHVERVLPRHPRCASPVAHSAGFSVVELMAVVVVLAILAVVSVPTFIEVINTNRLAARTNDVVSMLQNARLEAIRRGARVVVCPSDDGSACVTGSSWQRWIAFVDADADSTLDAGEQVLLTEALGAPLQMQSSSHMTASSTGRIVFRPDGFAYRSNGTTLLSANLRICHPTRRPLENARDVAIEVARISIARVDAGEACAAPDNP